MRIKLLLGLIAGQLLLPAAGFALSGVALRASGSRQCTVKAYANLATRASRSPDLLSLSAQQLSTAETTNAEVAWTQSASGDNALLTAIAPSLKLLTPAIGAEVTVSEMVGEGKGLVVFMRHIG